jgi:hypothetical protein
MNLKTGTGSVRENYALLMSEPVGPTRKKAIQTIAKKYGVSFEMAKMEQALTIAKAQVTKK